jgi:hypothetical protein
MCAGKVSRNTTGLFKEYVINKIHSLHVSVPGRGLPQARYSKNVFQGGYNGDETGLFLRGVGNICCVIHCTMTLRVITLLMNTKSYYVKIQLQNPDDPLVITRLYGVNRVCINLLAPEFYI